MSANENISDAAAKGVQKPRWLKKVPNIVYKSVSSEGTVFVPRWESVINLKWDRMRSSNVSAAPEDDVDKGWGV